MQQTTTDWLIGTSAELSQLGHLKPLSDEQTNWLLDVYTHYQLSPQEAAQYFLHERISPQTVNQPIS
ncbi:hypothetical protein GCM10028805_26170 [Spirosoma harenae]